MAANWALEGRTLDPDPEKTRYPPLKQQKPAAAVDAALRFWGGPSLTPRTRRELVGFAQRAARAATSRGSRSPTRSCARTRCGC